MGYTGPTARQGECFMAVAEHRSYRLAALALGRTTKDVQSGCKAFLRHSETNHRREFREMRQRAPETIAA